MRRALTLFDLDHTLLEGDSDVLWVEFLMDRGVLQREVFEPRNRRMQGDYRNGTVSAREFCEFYVSSLAGRSRQGWSGLRSAYFESAIVPRIGRAALDLVAKHRDAGDLLVLSTATNRFLSELTASFIGIENLIATECEVGAADCFTGRIAGTLNMREGKVTRLHEWLAAQHRALHEFDSLFYSDSINDLALFEVVDRAVAVNPDPRLAAHCAKHGWPVLQL
ncbi:MAG: HAD-IB family hydrolase [Burkholderiaceae bacterium]